MSFRVTRGPDRKPILTLHDEAAYCRALDAAPPAREPELDRGAWLIVAFAAWSAPDIGAIQTALDAAKRFEGRVSVGLRPFDDFEEFATWNPETVEGGSPVWIVLLDGEKCWQHQGLVTVEAVVDAIEGAIEKCRDRVNVSN